MDQQLKQRIVGAVVLISLAVIIIPILLDGNRQPRLIDGKSNVPPRPDYQFDALEIPLNLPGERAEAASEDTPAPKPIDRKPPPTPEPVVEQPVAKTPEPKPVTAKTSKSTTPAKTKPLARPEPLSRSALKEPWVVQLGSFGSEKNATALRDRLRKARYQAYLEPIQHDGERQYRVRIGPVEGREAAEKLRQRVEKGLSLKGAVMPDNP